MIDEIFEQKMTNFTADNAKSRLSEQYDMGKEIIITI